MTSETNMSSLHSQSDYFISEETMRMFAWVVYGVVCQTVNIFGIATNIINIMCFVKQGFKDSVNISLLGLSVSDLLCLITQIWINLSLTPPVRSADLPFDPPEVIYLVALMPHCAFSRVTNWNTAVITLERCLCNMAPLKVKYIVTPKLTACFIAGVYIIFTFSAAPMYVVNRLGMKFSTKQNRSLFGLIFMKDREYVEKMSYIANNFSVPLVAFAIIVASTIALTLALRRASEWRHKSIHSQDDRVYNRNQRVGKMVVMISSLFIVCFIPVNIIMVAVGFEPELSYGGRYLNIGLMLAGLSFVLESVNSSLNILIYYHMSSKYRNTLLEIYFLLKKEQKRPSFQGD